MKRRRRSDRRKRQRRIYVLPNLFTSANLFCGFYAIIAAIQGGFTKASVAILIATVFDALDGKIARVTGTMSKFGLEYDSLSDAVSFGVAPGVLVYLWALEPFGRLGWLAALLFVACGILRLARFNTLADRVSSAYFMGLPIPAAASMIATTVLVMNRLGGTGTARHVTILIMIYVLSFLMVSTVKYYSFKRAGLFRAMRFNMLVFFILLAIVIAAEPSIALFVIMLAYVVSGPFVTLRHRQANQPQGADRAEAPSQETT
ncbi:MAG: CDP-diacylglycerol--serine O-phosphatidyltransferase [Deltaproteobacteria bacterium]|nr:CDP-diacylglycerol--serine O-phosphatidyltransferase [Deltaproteobacteria bacterium]